MKVYKFTCMNLDNDQESHVEFYKTKGEAVHEFEKYVESQESQGYDRTNIQACVEVFVPRAYDTLSLLNRKGTYLNVIKDY